ncbi:MAG TPA: hypothetical protein VMG35_14630 [Bryobacteraceae bacterium]|nr:hypothetical protein [Bryobacteraceae bacterium]
MAIKMLGGLAAWFGQTNEFSAQEKQRLNNIIGEAADGSIPGSKVGGRLELDGLVFQEYKAGTNNQAALRFFGFHYGSDFCVTAIARHVKNGKVNRYEGMTWHGKDHFPPTFVGPNTELTEIVPAAFEEYLTMGK